MDVRPYLDYPVFERLRDPGFFALVQADHGTVSWPGGIDLDPDSVYLESVPVQQTAAAYAACVSDSDCVAGTTCINLPPNAEFLGGQTCKPLCNPPTQAHLACALGGTCEVVDTAARDFGFCARKADGG